MCVSILFFPPFFFLLCVCVNLTRKLNRFLSMQFPALKLARWTMCVVFLFRFGRIVQDLDDEWVLLSFTHTHTHTQMKICLYHILPWQCALNEEFFLLFKPQ
jgi:hypothetical protein